MRLLTETKTAQSFEEKQQQQQPGRFSSHGRVNISAFGGVLMVTGTSFQEGRYPRLQPCSGRSSSIPLLSQLQLGVFSPQGQKIPSRTQQSPKSSSSSSLGCHNVLEFQLRFS